MYLPRPVRRRLHQRDARIRAQAQRQERARVRRLRDRRRYRYVFVVAYGRSGSTLVQGLLNTLPRTVVAGESDLYVLHLFRAAASVRAFQRDHKRHGIHEPVAAFYRLTRIKRGPFHQAMNDIVTAGILGRDNPTDYDVVGFKEVRWYRIQPEETDDFFAAMDARLPRRALHPQHPQSRPRCPVGVLGRRSTRTRPSPPSNGPRPSTTTSGRADRNARSTSAYEDLVDPELVDDRLRLLAEFATGTRPSEELLASLRARLAIGHGPNPFGGRDPVSPREAADG